MTTAPTVSSGEIVNRVAQSGILTFNIEDFRPKAPLVGLDIKQTLFMELMLKEKDFRDWVKAHDWSQYQGQHVAVFCSTDAIVPAWPYMLIATRLGGIAASVYMGTVAEMEEALMRAALQAHDWAQYQDAKVVVKGCGGISHTLYTEVTWQLLPYVAKLMYGEPCSMVPLYKRS